MSAPTLGLADLFSLASVHDCVIEGPGHRQNPNRPADSKGSTGFHFFWFFCGRFHYAAYGHQEHER